MKLSDLDTVDRQILFELDLDCQITTTELAERVGKSRQTVDHRIKELLAARVVSGFQTAINPHRIGIRLYKLYLKLRSIPDQKKKLLGYLRRSGEVYWLGECSGSWDIICALYARDDSDFFTKKNSILSRFKEIIVDQTGGVLIDVLQFPKRWIYDESSEPVTFGGPVETNSLTDQQFGILKELVNDARQPIYGIAQKVGSTLPTVQAQIRRLEMLGVIIQYRISVDLSVLGLQLYKTIVRFESYSSEEEKRFRAFVSNLPSLQYLIRDMWQYELEFVTEDFNHYSKLIDTIRREFPYLLRSVDTVLMATDEWTPGMVNFLGDPTTPRR